MTEDSSEYELAWPRITTERLLLNAHVLDDAPALHAYRSNPEINRYLTWAPADLAETRRSLESLLATAFATPGTWSQLAVRSRDGRRLIGDVAVRMNVDESRQGEIGYTLAPQEHGRGYGSEAVAGLLGYLFGVMKLHRVYASVDPGNRASMALLDRIGMRREGHFRQSLWLKGEWVDDVIYAILRSEWSAAHSDPA